MWLIFNRDKSGVRGSIPPPPPHRPLPIPLPLCVPLPPKMAALEFVLISFCPCKMHVVYFTIQNAAAISVSHQDSSLAGPPTAVPSGLLNCFYSLVKVWEVKITSLKLSFGFQF